MKRMTKSPRELTHVQEMNKLIVLALKQAQNGSLWELVQCILCAGFSIISMSKIKNVHVPNAFAQ